MKVECALVLLFLYYFHEFIIHERDCHYSSNFFCFNNGSFIVLLVLCWIWIQFNINQPLKIIFIQATWVKPVRCQCLFLIFLLLFIQAKLMNGETTSLHTSFCDISVKKHTPRGRRWSKIGKYLLERRRRRRFVCHFTFLTLSNEQQRTLYVQFISNIDLVMKVETMIVTNKWNDDQLDVNNRLTTAFLNIIRTLYNPFIHS